MDCSDGQTVHTTMPYLARDRLYSTEKPFGADFRVDHLKGSQSANHIFERSSVAIHDIRKVRKPILEQNGFCFFKAATELKAEDATNEENTPTRQYLQDIQRILYERFPEYCRIEVMDFQVRSSPFQKGSFNIVLLGSQKGSRFPTKRGGECHVSTTSCGASRGLFH